MYTPMDIYRYVTESGKESEFLSAIMLQRKQYSIAEIPDALFVMEAGKCRLKSGSYRLNIAVDDMDIQSAVLQRRYISAFISRHTEQYQVHFLVHGCRIEEKTHQEEEIVREVVRCMILKTIIALRLTTPQKVDDYLVG